MNESIIDAAKIARINELYHKSKVEGLTEEEKKEINELLTKDENIECIFSSASTEE